MSRKLNVASALLFIVGMWGVFHGFVALFWTEEILRGWIEVAKLGLTISQIRGFGQDLLDFMIVLNRFFGLYALSTGLFICIVSLLHYRKGERWAWYSMLIIGGIITIGMLILQPSFIVFIVTFILWILGMALPAKEILGK